MFIDIPVLEYFDNPCLRVLVAWDKYRYVSKLRHHVSALSKRNHVLQKEVNGRKKEEEAESSEVASPRRGQECEPQVVAEPLGWTGGMIVEEVEEDVWVVCVAERAVAESRVALEMEVPEVALVRLPKGRKRRLNVGNEGGSGDEAKEVEVILVEVNRPVVVAPLGPTLDMARGNRLTLVGSRLGDRPGVRGWDVVRLEYRFEDRSLVGLRNRTVGDSYHARGGSTCVQVRGSYRREYVERGHRPYR